MIYIYISFAIVRFRFFHVSVFPSAPDSRPRHPLPTSASDTRSDIRADPEPICGTHLRSDLRADPEPISAADTRSACSAGPETD